MYVLTVSKVNKRWKKRWMCKWTIGYCSLRNASPLSITCENKTQTDTVLYKINAFHCLLSCFTHLQSGRVSEYIFPHQTRKWELWFLPCMEIHWVGFECFFVNRGFIETLIQLFSCWLQQQTMETSCTWWLCSLLRCCSSLGDCW